MRHRRAEFSAETKRQAFARSGGICECHRIPGWQGCGVKLVDGAIFYEHINTSYHSSDSSLDNAAVLTRTCWKRKTAEHDLPSIAKTKRISDLARGIKRHVSRPLPGSRASGIKLRFSGPPLDRSTGLPWRGR